MTREVLVHIRYAGKTASLFATAEDGWHHEEPYESGSALAEGLTRLGLDRIMRREHLSIDDFIRAADARLAQGGSRTE